MSPSVGNSIVSIDYHDGQSRKPVVPNRTFSDPSRLAPGQVYTSLLRPSSIAHERSPEPDGHMPGITGLRGSSGTRRHRPKDGTGGRSRRDKKTWKKLLWVKQKDYPDNYTDPPTFLSHLQRNPRLRPYDFWPLVADSTVIVQHVSSVAIFVCSFVGIYQQRTSPVSVVSWGTASTVLGWALSDYWTGQSESMRLIPKSNNALNKDEGDFLNGSALSSHPTTAIPTPTSQSAETQPIGLGLYLSTANLAPNNAHGRAKSQASVSSGPSPVSHTPSHSHSDLTLPPSIPYTAPRTQQRFATAKSAILIYITLLGLSPILKSLTESTSSDSIWAMTCWLMCINVFFFDYSGGVGAVKFPASLSTNAALMASTVLASRLPSTTHVFSLTLFSIEVFGLFPVFRRQLRHMSWQGHMFLTLILMFSAGAGLGLIISGRPFWSGGWKRAIGGAFVWSLGSTFGMGACSWWLINLQRYKNVVIGPWDPARPVIRGAGWE